MGQSSAMDMPPDGHTLPVTLREDLPVMEQEHALFPVLLQPGAQSFPVIEILLLPAVQGPHIRLPVQQVITVFALPASFLFRYQAAVQVIAVGSASPCRCALCQLISLIIPVPLRAASMALWNTFVSAKNLPFVYSILVKLICCLRLLSSATLRFSKTTACIISKSQTGR